jgi:hypothetical protein
MKRTFQPSVRKNVTNTDSENVWHLSTVVRYYQEEEEKEEKGLLFLMKFEENNTNEN